jgi:predicted nucleic acid-binding protein
VVPGTAPEKTQMNYLLDTNILRETTGARPDIAVHRRVTETPKDQLFTSAICMTEMRIWTRRSDNPGKRWERVQFCVRNVTVLPFDAEDAKSAGDLIFDLQKRGLPLDGPDALIAATALRHGMTLVTRNTRHFDRVPYLRIENWFE